MIGWYPVIWPNHPVPGFDYRMIYRMMQSFFNIGGPAAPQTPLLPWGASPPRPLDPTVRNTSSRGWSQEYPVITRHILWSQDMSCDHNVLWSQDTRHVLWSQDTRHVLWSQDMSCHHETCLVITRHVLSSVDQPTERPKVVITRAPDVHLRQWLVHSAAFFKTKSSKILPMPNSHEKDHL